MASLRASDNFAFKSFDEWGAALVAIIWVAVLVVCVKAFR